MALLHRPKLSFRQVAKMMRESSVTFSLMSVFCILIPSFSIEFFSFESIQHFDYVYFWLGICISFAREKILDIIIF